ncbi:MAG: hypothetical protein ACI3T9_07725 [Romboutsia timonensis]
MKRYDYIRHGILKINKECKCPICQKEFKIKIEDRFGIDTPILIVKCSHDEVIYNYLLEERGEE